MRRQAAPLRERGALRPGSGEAGARASIRVQAAGQALMLQIYDIDIT